VRLFESKAESKRQNHENILKNIIEREEKRETFQQNKIYKKGAMQETYEKLCHI
jgi:hypothetical protein